MHPMPPAMAEGLMRARQADLRRRPATRPRRRSRDPRRLGLRRKTGWWLVTLGLRLAVPVQQRPVQQRPVQQQPAPRQLTPMAAR